MFSHWIFMSVKLIQTHLNWYRDIYSDTWNNRQRCRAFHVLRKKKKETKNSYLAACIETSSFHIISSAL